MPDYLGLSSIKKKGSDVNNITETEEERFLDLIEMMCRYHAMRSLDKNYIRTEVLFDLKDVSISYFDEEIFSAEIDFAIETVESWTENDY